MDYLFSTLAIVVVHHSIQTISSGVEDGEEDSGEEADSGVEEAESGEEEAESGVEEEEVEEVEEVAAEDKNYCVLRNSTETS